MTLKSILSIRASILSRVLLEKGILSGCPCVYIWHFRFPKRCLRTSPSQSRRELKNRSFENIYSEVDSTNEVVAQDNAKRSLQRNPNLSDQRSTAIRSSGRTFEPPDFPPKEELRNYRGVTTPESGVQIRLEAARKKTIWRPKAEGKDILLDSEKENVRANRALATKRPLRTERKHCGSQKASWHY